MQHFRAEQILALEFGLTPMEVMRALKWARAAKLARGKPDGNSRRPRNPAGPKIEPPRKEPERVWCDQCERNVIVDEAASCSSKWCKAKEAVA